MKNILKKIAPDILMLVGLALITAGVARFSPPMGLIVGGGFCVFTAWAAFGGDHK